MMKAVGLSACVQLSYRKAGTARTHRRRYIGRLLLVSGAIVVAALCAANIAFADPAIPSPTPPVSPGIYGPLVGGGQMTPPPVVGPDLAPPGGSDPSWWDIPGQIKKAIDTWLGSLVKSALEPVLRLIGSTLLSSPDVSDGRIAQVWTGILITANSLYVLLVLVGAVIVMGHETVQSRYSAKEIAPRLALGIIASNVSLWAISQSVSLGNALAVALMRGQLSAEGIGSRLTEMIVGKIFLPTGVDQLFLVLIGGTIAVMGVVLLITCLLRSAVLLTLTAGAPLALACHALPQTEGLAMLWWRAIIGCLATQVAQALVLITGCQIFFDPNADTLLGIPSGGGLVDLLLALVLIFVLIKIPIWVTRVVLGRRPLGATLIGRLAKSYLLYRGFNLARSHLGGRSDRARPTGAWHNRHHPGPPAPGTGLVPFNGGGPRPGSGGLGGWRPAPETVTVSTGSATPSAESSQAGGARPHGPAPLVPLGPVRKPLALPVGRSTRLDRLQQQNLNAPPAPRGRQYGLFSPPEKEPGIASVRTYSPPPKPPPLPGEALKHRPAFPKPVPAPRKRSTSPTRRPPATPNEMS